MPGKQGGIEDRPAGTPYGIPLCPKSVGRIEERLTAYLYAQKAWAE
ncbi:hypothetical protein [Lacrimispora sp.]|nr:hypothetical protein [Lacrimispora sp.]